MRARAGVGPDAACRVAAHRLGGGQALVCTIHLEIDTLSRWRPDSGGNRVAVIDRTQRCLVGVVVAAGIKIIQDARNLNAGGPERRAIGVIGNRHGFATQNILGRCGIDIERESIQARQVRELLE